MSFILSFFDISLAPIHRRLMISLRWSGVWSWHVDEGASSPVGEGASWPVGEGASWPVGEGAS